MNEKPDLSEFGSSVRGRRQPAEPYPYAEGQATAEPPPFSGLPFVSNQFTQWTSPQQNLYMAISNAVDTLPAGHYKIGSHQGQPTFYHLPNKVDDLLRFPDSKADAILSEIDNFWKRGTIFKEHGFLHRRGYMFYGPQGSGKTCLVQQVIAEVVQRKGIVFGCEHPSIFKAGLLRFREVEPDRHVVCLFEDIDALMDRHGEEEFLSLLDGEEMLDKVLNIATTNYPERLDARIVQRPRRFDRVIKVDMPGKEIRRMYFERKLKIATEEIDMWVAATEGFSFAACAELVISVKCLGNEFDYSVEVLEALKNSKPSSQDFREQAGFLHGNRRDH